MFYVFDVVIFDDFCFYLYGSSYFFCFLVIMFIDYSNRSFHPYFIPTDSHGINTARMAEVWMDDFKRFYYMHRQDLKGKDVGDLSDRLELRDRFAVEFGFQKNILF